MVYVWEFEFFDSDGVVDAVPCGSLGGGGTFGSDLNDAVESAADFLACMVDDHLMGGVDLPAPDFGHEPQHGGKIIAVAVSRELGDIPAVTAADAARMLGVSSARVSQLINAGLLDSWKDGTKRMVSKASIEARLADAPKAALGVDGEAAPPARVHGHDIRQDRDRLLQRGCLRVPISPGVEGMVLPDCIVRKRVGGEGVGGGLVGRAGPAVRGDDPGQQGRAQKQIDDSGFHR